MGYSVEHHKVTLTGEKNQYWLESSQWQHELMAPPAVRAGTSFLHITHFISRYDIHPDVRHFVTKYVTVEFEYLIKFSLIHI